MEQEDGRAIDEDAAEEHQPLECRRVEPWEEQAERRQRHVHCRGVGEDRSCAAADAIQAALDNLLHAADVVSRVDAIVVTLIAS